MPRVRLIALSALLLLAAPAAALILTGGREPATDHNFPLYALDLINQPTRFAWLEGPPFGGGEWQFLYRGDAAACQKAIDAFAALRAPALRVILHEGPHKSPFASSDAPAAEANIDWAVTLWDPTSWNNLYNNPRTLFGSDDPRLAFRSPVAPPTLDVYLAGPDGKGLNGKALTFPAVLQVTDERATSHGYSATDGSVVTVDAYDMVTAKPLANATLALQNLKRSDRSTPLEDWQSVATAKANADGRIELTQIPTGYFRLALSAEGYVTRVIASLSFTPNTFKTYTAQLTAPVALKGVVHDTAGKPLPDVTVRADAVVAIDGKGYALAATPKTTTDADGKFEFPALPKGFLHLHASDNVHYLLDPLRIHTIGADTLALTMTATGTVRGKLLNRDGTPATGGNVTLLPGGDPLGQWSGSMNVNADGTLLFTNVPPGHYTLSANPRAILGNDPTGKPVDLKAGETVDAVLTK